MSNQGTIKIKVPRQTLDHSSFFNCSEKAVQAWVNALPMANLGETTRQLYKALNEFNQVRVLPAQRMALLEILRSPIYFVSRALAKHYLNQPIVLSQQAGRVADLTHALHHQLAMGYTITATQLSALGKKGGLGKPKQIIGRALHRAITDHTLNMLRHYQLYEPVDEGIWRNLHQFFCLARQHEILDQIVKDAEFGDSTVEASYVRAVLIGCAKPNQLRQEDFMAIFKPLTYWAGMCRVANADMPGLFVINAEDDKPPVYRELYSSVLDGHWLSLGTGMLTMHLTRLLHSTSESDSAAKDGDNSISKDLLSHLIQAWSVVSQRTNMRMENDEELNVSVGLAATHHFISGELSFESLTEERGASAFTLEPVNPFMKNPGTPSRNKDVWDKPYEANAGQIDMSLEEIDYSIRKNEITVQDHSEDKEKYPCYRVKMINSSAHGYCIELPADNHAHIKTGEIIGVRQPDRHNWSVGVIRWVVHARNQQTRLGLELISPSASPYGIRIVHSKGPQSEFSRALVLPEVPAIDRPITLVTPKVPFRVGQKVVLNQRGKEVKMMLCRKVNESGAFCQFEFRRVANKPKIQAADTHGVDYNNNDDEFDSLWNSL